MTIFIDRSSRTLSKTKRKGSIGPTHAPSAVIKSVVLRLKFCFPTKLNIFSLCWKVTVSLRVKDALCRESRVIACSIFYAWNACQISYLDGKTNERFLGKINFFVGPQSSEDCRSNGWGCNTISFACKFKLFKSLVTSLFLYGCEA